MMVLIVTAIFFRIIGSTIFWSLLPVYKIQSAKFWKATDVIIKRVLLYMKEQADTSLHCLPNQRMILIGFTEVTLKAPVQW